VQADENSQVNFRAVSVKKVSGRIQFFVMVAVSGYTRNAVKYEANSKRIKATNVLDV